MPGRLSSLTQESHSRPSGSSTRREDIISRCVRVNKVFHREVDVLFRDPTASSFPYASFSDPDGNSWLLQGVNAASGPRVGGLTPTSLQHRQVASSGR